MMEIIHKINTDTDLNTENIKEKIKNGLQSNDVKLYKEWEKSNFNINHLFSIDGFDFRQTFMGLAAFKGCTNVLKTLIDIGADFKICNSLHLAARGGNLETIKYLCKKNADFSIGDNKGQTPLHHAILMGHFEVVKYLIDNKKVDFIIFDKNFWSPLHYAAYCGHLNIVKYLIDVKKADFTIGDKEGWTPLYSAIIKNNLEIVEYLTNEKNSNLTIVDNNGMTPLHFAAHLGHLDIVKYLIDQKNMNYEITDDHGMTPLHFAYIAGHWKIIKYLINEKNAVSKRIIYNETLRSVLVRRHKKLSKLFAISVGCSKLAMKCENKDRR